MALTRQTSRRTLILTPSDAEVSTNQVYASRYEWRVDGELSLPSATVIDSLKHTDAAFSIYRVDVSVNIGGTSQYQVLIKSYDTAGLDPVTHVDEYITLTGDKNRISVAVLNAAVAQNRSLELTLFENSALVSASDMTVTLIAEDFADLAPARDGHRILNAAAVVQAQRPDLQFDVDGAGLSLMVTDDAPNNRTVIQYSSNMGFIGQYLESDLTLAQHQALYGAGWVLADGVTSVVGSIYGTVTGRTVAPDARGVFRRAKNNGRADGNEDPEGERALASYQADQFQGHWHTLGGATNSADTANDPQTSLTGSTGATTAVTTALINQNYIRNPKTDGVNGTPRTGEETRVKNLAVNVFIKIN